MRLKEIHDAYCEKQRIAEEERVKLEIEEKQKALEAKMQSESEILKRIKPLFLKEFEQEVKIIEQAGIRVSYVTNHKECRKLFVEMQTDELYAEMTYNEAGHFRFDGGFVESKEHLMSLVYQYFFC